jgi:hypothetical protein
MRGIWWSDDETGSIAVLIVAFAGIFLINSGEILGIFGE